MPYVQRNIGGAIVGVAKWPSPTCTELVADDDAELLALFASRAATGYPVPRLLVVERLQAAGKLAAARSALDNAPLLAREKWNAAQVVMSDNPDALALLLAIGADPAVILAQP